MVCQCTLGTLLTQPLVCLIVFFPGGKCHKLNCCHTIPINIGARDAKMQFCSTPTITSKNMTTLNEPTNLSKPEGLITEPGKTQHPIEWLRNQFDLICSFKLDQEQSEPLLSASKQSFVPDVLEQIQALVRDHMSEVLVNHCTDQQL